MLYTTRSDDPSVCGIYPRKTPSLIHLCPEPCVSELRLPLVGADPGPRTFVIDTNVLLYDPRAIFVFQEHDLVIPMTVIEEIDQFKKDLSEVGRNARMVSRYLDRMRDQGSLREGVMTQGGGRIRVDYTTHGPDLPITWGPENNDNRILRSVLRLQRELAGNVAFITRGRFKSN